MQLLRSAGRAQRGGGDGCVCGCVCVGVQGGYKGPLLSLTLKTLGEKLIHPTSKTLYKSRNTSLYLCLIVQLVVRPYDAS
jgi:hypothetical protein